MPLPDKLLDVLRAPAICFLTTLEPDGSPQVTQTWVDTDGENLIINTVSTHRKTHNIARDARVAVGIADPAAPSRSWGIRGRVVSVTTDGAEEHIDELSQKYTGKAYPWYGGREQQRVLLTISPDRVHSPRG